MSFNIINKVGSNLLGLSLYSSLTLLVRNHSWFITTMRSIEIPFMIFLFLIKIHLHCSIKKFSVVRFIRCPIYTFSTVLLRLSSRFVFQQSHFHIRYSHSLTIASLLKVCRLFSGVSAFKHGKLYESYIS